MSSAYITNSMAIELPVLMKWLKSRVPYSDDLFCDPGYSRNYYMAFGNTYEYGSEYTPGDIDHQLNPGYYDPIYDIDDDYGISDEDYYVDYIYKPIDKDTLMKTVMSYEPEYRDKAARVLQREPILILPGSNQSNANYIYKLMLDQINQIHSFRIPYVKQSNRAYFTGSSKNFRLQISKEDTYRFVCYMSIVAAIHGYSARLGIESVDIAESIIDQNDAVYLDVDNGGNMHRSYKLKNQSQKTNNHNHKREQELRRIDPSIINLINELHRYNRECHNIWNSLFIPFINSNNCLTMKYAIDDDDSQFIRFMQGNTIYTIMQSSLNRLRNRKQYLMH